MEPLKEMFNRKFYENLANELQKADKNFKHTAFINRVTANIEVLSLNERMRNTSLVIKDFLPESYGESIELLKQVVPKMPGGYTNLLFPDFVSLYGMNSIDLSLQALKFFTKYGSSEFAIRQFLKFDFDKTIKVMYSWAEDSNHHVRRLASEGSRPRLPWSFKLDRVIREPNVTKPILERLNKDKELYVRKSVANHLNDISKDNSGYMLNLIKGWDRANAHTNWIVKHACRTLIKKGDSKSLSLFNFKKNVKVKLQSFKLNKSKIKLGEELRFDFEIVLLNSVPQKLAIDYVIHYKKKAGEYSPKVFKLKEIEMKQKQLVSISKKQAFKDFTTRKHYSGKHILEIQVNGQKLIKKEFTLMV